MQPPSKGGKKVYIFRPDHITKMAAMLIFNKILEKPSPKPLLQTACPLKLLGQFE